MLHTSHLALVQLYPNYLVQKIPIPLLVEEHSDSTQAHCNKKRLLIQNYIFKHIILRNI